MPRQQQYQRFRNEEEDRDDHDDELLSGIASMSRSCMSSWKNTSSTTNNNSNSSSNNSRNFNDIPAIQSTRGSSSSNNNNSNNGGVDHQFGNGVVVISSSGTTAGCSSTEVVDVEASPPSPSPSPSPSLSSSSRMVLRVDMDGSVSSNRSNGSHASSSTSSRNSSRNNSSANHSTSDEDDEDVVVVVGRDGSGYYADGSFPSSSCSTNNYPNAKKEGAEEGEKGCYDSVLSTTFQQSRSFDSSSSFSNQYTNNNHCCTEDDVVAATASSSSTKQQAATTPTTLKKTSSTKTATNDERGETATTGTTKTWFMSRYAAYGCLLVGILLLFLTGLLVGMYTANGSIGNTTTTSSSSSSSSSNSNNAVGSSSSIKISPTISPDSENVNATISPGGSESGDAVDDAEDADDEWDVDKEIEPSDEDDSTVEIAPVTAYWNAINFRPSPSPSISSSPSVSMSPSAAPSSSPTVIQAEVDVNPIDSPSSQVPPKSTYTVGVFYYPLHGSSSIETSLEDDPSNSVSINRGINDKGHHMFGNYVRKDLVPRQYPMLGEYNDADPDIIREHIRMLRRANVNLLVTNWSGPGHPSDVSTKSLILPNEDLTSNNMKVALHYDIVNRLPYFDDGDGDTISYNSHRSWTEEVADLARADTRYLCDEYFNHPNFYKLNGRPVVVIDTVSYRMANKTHWVEVLEESLMAIRSEASKCGHFLYLVGNGVVKDGQSEESLPFWYFDAVTNYVVQTEENSKGYAGKEHVDEYFTHQSKIQDEMFLEDCRFIPAVSPGFNDRSIHPERSNPVLSRRLTEGSEEGTLFYYQLQRAKSLVDPAVDNMILINSFNDWKTDTQVEPVASSPTSSWPPSKTEGLEYDGYDYLYLDILGASTTSIQHQGIFDYLYDM